jgi:hypothetical protein
MSVTEKGGKPLAPKPAQEGGIDACPVSRFAVTDRAGIGWSNTTVEQADGCNCWDAIHYLDPG